MTTWFVTRHPGAIIWARNHGVKVADGGIVGSLDVKKVQAGDLVVGTLPINLAAEVIGKGARYLHLSMNTSPEMRGRELTADEMEQCGARLEEFWAEKRNTPELASAGGIVREVMICIASGQTQQNALPLFVRTPQRLCLFVSDDHKAIKSAERIVDVAKRRGIKEIDLFDHMPSAPLQAIREFAKEKIAEIRKKEPNANLILNATGGTKLMSAGVGEVIGPVGEVFYCDTENDRIEYIQPEGKLPQDIEPTVIGLNRLLTIQGLNLDKQAQNIWFKVTSSREALTMHLAEIVAKCEETIDQMIGQLNFVANKADEKRSGSKLIKPFEPKQQFDKIDEAWRETFGLFKEAGLWDWDDSGKDVTFKGLDAVGYLKGGWLEEYVAVEIRKLFEELAANNENLIGKNGESLKRHWGANVKVSPISASNPKSKSMNELDAAVVWRNRLLVIECKTTSGIRNKDEGQTIGNKLEAISHYVGGPFCDKWLVSARKLDTKAVAMERYRQFNIRVFSPGDLLRFRDHLRSWMKLDHSKK